MLNSRLFSQFSNFLICFQFYQLLLDNPNIIVYTGCDDDYILPHATTRNQAERSKLFSALSRNAPKIIVSGMGFDNEKSFIMAERLKQLRESKGLSHEKLSKTILELYDVKISSDSLQNYEVADANHTKAYKNQGMRVEYLRCLADFYGVSTDYVLGLTNTKNPDMTIRGIMDQTGLSENVVNWLTTFNEMSEFIPNLPADYSKIMEESTFHALLEHLREYCKATVAEWTYSQIVESCELHVGYVDAFAESALNIDRQIEEAASELEPQEVHYLRAIHKFADQHDDGATLARSLFGADWVIPSELCAHRASRELTLLIHELRESVQKSLVGKEAKKNVHD